MTNSDLFDRIVGHLVEVARAHHAATGGANPRWARWYSERLVDVLNDALDSEMDVDDLEEWLLQADTRYRAETPPMSWPKAYAGWLLADQE